MAKPSIQIIPRPDSVSLEQLTDLLHDAYAVHLSASLKYGAAVQSVEETAGRLQHATCLVALLNGELVGTISYEFIIENGRRGIYFFMLAVSSAHKGQHIATNLIEVLHQIASAEKVDFIVADTAKDAKWLLRWYCGKLGFHKYTLFRQSGRDYLSVSFRKYLRHKTIHSLLCRLHFWASYIYIYIYENLSFLSAVPIPFERTVIPCRKERRICRTLPSSLALRASMQSA